MDGGDAEGGEGAGAKGGARSQECGVSYPFDGYWQDAQAKITIGDGYLSWLPAPELRFAAGPAARAEALAHEEAEERTLAQAADAIYIVGATPCGLWREWLGVYRKLRHEPLQGGRFVYAQESDGSSDDSGANTMVSRGGLPQRMLWYTDGVYWRLGGSEFLGQPRGPFKVRDAALRPEYVVTSFEVGNGGEGSPWDMTDGRSGWLPAPGVRILTGEIGRSTAQAEGLPVCVDAEEFTMQWRLRGMDECRHVDTVGVYPFG